MFYSPANHWKVAAKLSPRTKYGLTTSSSPAWPYPDPPPHPPLEPHYVIPLSHLYDPLYDPVTGDPPLWWDMSGSGGGGGAGAPSPPVNSVQFNNAGAFGGDANLTWDATNGLQAQGTSYSFVAKSPNYQTTMASTSGGALFQGHVAIGNYADVDVGLQWPGDGPAQDTYNVALLVDDFVSGDLGSNNVAAQAIYTGIQNTGSGQANYTTLMLKPNVVGANTGPFNSYQALWIDTSTGGSGAVANHWGIRLACNIGGTVNCTNLTGMEIILNNFANGQTTTNSTALKISGFNNFGTMTNVCGIQIADLSGLGTNLHSIGSNALNLFDGKIRLGVSTNSNPQDGDLWYDGTHLNFRHGGTTTALV